MARIEESIEIKIPVDKLFSYTTDAKSWPKWQSVLPEAEQTSQGPMNIGTTFKGIFRMMGLSMKWTAEVTEYEQDVKWAKNITCGSMIIKEQVTYEPREERMKFTIAYDIKVGGFLKLFSSMMVSMMRKETIKSLGNLKRISEAQA